MKEDQSAVPPHVTLFIPLVRKTAFKVRKETEVKCNAEPENVTFVTSPVIKESHVINSVSSSF